MVVSSLGLAAPNLTGDSWWSPGMGPNIQEKEALVPGGPALYVGNFGMISGLLGSPWSPNALIMLGILPFEIRSFRFV